MSFSLVKAIFVNRAPFEHIEFDFKEGGINVLSAINGKGKTTLLSHVVDAFMKWQNRIIQALLKVKKINSIDFLLLYFNLIPQSILLLISDLMLTMKPLTMLIVEEMI